MSKNAPKWADLYGMDPNFKTLGEPDAPLTTSAVAELLGIAPATWRAYVSRGQAPKPDGHHDARTPYWKRETVEAWRPSA